MAEVLNEAGYTVLVQDLDFRYSDNFITAMHFALKRARNLIVLLTRDYDRSPFTLAEVSNFLAGASRPGSTHRLVVLRVDNCEPEGIFAGIIYADLAGVDDLLERKRRILAAATGRSLVESRGHTSDSRETVGRLRNATAASTFAGKIEPFLEEYLVSEDLGRVPFAGRNEELDCLDRWLDEATACPRFILTAPAGRGKSALVIQWMARLEARQSLGNSEGSWSLVFVPISMRFNTNRPEVFYEAIANYRCRGKGARHDGPKQRASAGRANGSHIKKCSD